MADRKTFEPPERQGDKTNVENKISGKQRGAVVEYKKDATEGGYSAEKARKILEAEAKTRNKSSEWGTVFDKDGNVKFVKMGYENYIQFEDDEVKMMRNGILSHNHPNKYRDKHWYGAIGSPFSELDVRFAVKANLAEIRAVTPTYTFSIKRPKGGWGKKEDVLKKIEEVYEKYGSEMRKYIWKDKDDKAIDERKDRASAIKGHKAVKELAKELGWSYTRRRNK